MKRIIFTFMVFLFVAPGIAQAQDSDRAICRVAHDLVVDVNSKNMGLSTRQGKDMWKAVRNSCTVNKTGNNFNVEQSYEFINQRTKQPMGGTINYKMRLIYANNMYYLCSFIEEGLDRADDFRRNIICSQ